MSNHNARRRTHDLSAAGALALAFAMVVAGFWPSFFRHPDGNDVAHLFHGTVATAWMLLLIVQAWAAATRRMPLHRALGRWSPVLVGLLIAASLPMVRAMLAAGTEGLPRDLRLRLAFVDVMTLALFIGLYVAGIHWRRDRHVHSRLLAMTALIGMIPGLGRLLARNVPALGGLGGGLDAAMAVVIAILAALIVNDLRLRRLSWPFPFGLVAFGAIALTMGQAPHSPAFMVLAGWLGFVEAAAGH